MTCEERHSGLAGVQSKRLSGDTAGNFQLGNLRPADRSHANQPHANKSTPGGSRSSLVKGQVHLTLGAELWCQVTG